MRDFKEIERDAAAERQQLASSLDALSAAVDPANVKDHVATLAEHYGGDLGAQAWGAARQNPAAFALVGAGIGLLLTGTGSRPETQPKPPTAASPEAALDGFDARVKAADAKMQEEQSNMEHAHSEPTAAWLRAKLNDGLDALPPAARKRVIAARTAAVDAQEKVEAQARAAAAKSRGFLQDQPLAVGAVAIGLGALVGALLPSTRREDDLLGERRDAVMAAARAALTEELDKAQDVARKSLHAS